MMKGSSVVSGLAVAAVLAMAPSALLAQGATFRTTNTDTARNWSEGFWEITEGTSSSTFPGEGDTAIIAAGTVVRMTEPHAAEHLIIEGEIRGSTTISWGGGVDLIHTFGSVTVKPGGIWRLADGVGEGGGSETIVTVDTIVTGDAVIENGGNLNAYRFSGFDRATLLVEGDFIDETTDFRFAVYPRPNWTLAFAGNEPSTIHLATGEASRNFTNVVISAGKEVTLDTFQPLYLEPDATLTVEQDATLNLVESAFFAGPGAIVLEDACTVAFAGPGGISFAVFQNAGSRTFSEAANFVYTAVGGAQVGELAPAAMSSLKVDTPDFVFLNKDLTVNDSLILTSGRLDTYDPLAAVDSVLTLGADASVIRGNGWVNGNLARTVDASQAGAVSFPLGSASDYTPVEIEITSPGSGMGTIAVTTAGEAFDPAPPMPALDRSWSIVSSGISGYEAVVMFTWAEGDAAGLSTDQLRAARFISPDTFEVPPGQVVDAASRTVTVPGVTAFSDWVIVEDATATSVRDWNLF